MAWSPFIVRAVQIYVASNFPQAAAVLGVKAETFREFLEQQGALRILRHHLRWGWSDRQRSARQRVAGVSLQAAYAFEYVAGKLAILFLFLVGVTWLPAIMLLLVQIMFAGSFTFVRDNIFLHPCDHPVLASASVARVDDDARALVDVKEQPFRRDHVCRADVLHCRALQRAARYHRPQLVRVAVAQRCRSNRLATSMFRLRPRYDLHGAVAVLVVVALIALSGWILERRVRGVEVVQ